MNTCIQFLFFSSNKGDCCTIIAPFIHAHDECSAKTDNIPSHDVTLVISFSLILNHFYVFFKVLWSLLFLKIIHCRKCKVHTHIYKYVCICVIAAKNNQQKNTIVVKSPIAIAIFCFYKHFTYFTFLLLLLLLLTFTFGICLYFYTL